jgi:hypothetical protein
MIVSTDKAAVEALKAADAKVQGFPMPGSWGKPLVNRCGACGEPVQGPDTRYRCKGCGKTADEYPCPMQFSSDVSVDEKGSYAYPDSETAVELVEAAKAKPDKDKSESDSLVAKCEIESKVK